MAGLPTDHESPPIAGPGILAQGFGVLHRDLHVAPGIGVFTTVYHHSVGSSQPPIVVVELEVRYTLRYGQKIGDDDGLRFFNRSLLCLVGGRVGKRLAGQDDGQWIRSLDSVDGPEQQSLR